MRTRSIKKQVWLNYDEERKLKEKSYITGLSESDLIRRMINDMTIREKPDDRFYDYIKEVRALDLINMNKSHCYNPFVYLKDDNDVQKLVTNLFKSTTPKGSQSSDPFWDTAASMLLLVLIFYLKYEAPEEEQNFTMVLELLRAGEVKEDEKYFNQALLCMDLGLNPKDLRINEQITKRKNIIF